jgi:antirestriction protein ArdC
MATKTARRLQRTAEQIEAAQQACKEEIEALTEQLNGAVIELTTSTAWVEMLKFSAQFTNYSPTNCLLLWLQAEQRGVTLTRVAGYRKWQSLGRQVVKGAKSFAVIAPVRRRLSVAEALERQAKGERAFDSDGRPAMVVRGFKLERVFRLEDTEGEALPEPPDVGYVTGDTPEGAWEALAGLVAADGFTLTANPEDGETRGHTNYKDRTVNVDPRFNLPERVHVLVHELGHVRCQHGGEGKREISRSQRETEAESVAFVVCSVLGFNLGDVSAVYNAGWNDGSPEIITAAQAAIHKAAQSILADLEAVA